MGISVLTDSAYATPANWQTTINAAAAAGDILLVPEGVYSLTIASATDSIRIPSNSHIRFSPGAVVAWSQSDIYYPPFVVLQSRDVLIEGMTLRFDGTLTFGVGKDFTAATDTDGPLCATTARYTATAYQDSNYCSGLLILESQRVTVRDFTGSGLTTASVIHAWVNAQNIYDLTVDNASFDDCCLGVLAGGHDRGVFSRLRGGRLSQDIGIPGHTLYTFMNDSVIDDVTDTGEESGALTATRLSSHTVSVKAGSNVTVSNIVSRRAAGPFNCLTTDGLRVRGVTWEANDTHASKQGAAVFFLVTTDYPRSVDIADVSLTTTRDDEVLFGGGVEAADIRDVTLTKTNNVAGTEGFFYLKGTGNVAAVSCVQLGSADAPVVATWDGSLEHNDYEFTCVDFNSTPSVAACSGTNTITVI